MRSLFYFVLVLFVSTPVFANEQVFDLLKSLEGEWESIPVPDEEPATIKYELIANGTAISEELWGMVTVYHLDNDRMMATHYCSAGNQPRMVAPLEVDDNRFVAFNFLDVTNDQVPGHISGVSFQFVHANKFVQSWSWQGDDGTINSFSVTYARKGSTDGYMIDIVDREPQLTLVQETQVQDNAAVGAELGRILPAVYGEIIRLGMDPGFGRPFSRYLEFTDNQIRFEAGLPIAEMVKVEAPFKVVEIDGGSFAKTTHYGSYELLGNAYTALHKWMEENGKTPAGAPVEVYVDDPTTTDPERVRTEIFYPVTF